MILVKVAISSAPLLWVVDLFNSDPMGANAAPPRMRASTILEMRRVSKVGGFRVRFLTFEAILLFSDLVLLQCNITVVLTSTLSHLRKVNDITRYIPFGFGLKQAMTGRKFVHLEEGDSQQSSMK